MISPGRFWWLFRRDLKRGVVAAWNEYMICPAIRNWRNPHQEQPACDIAVHVLTGAKDYLLSLWMLASWFGKTGRNWNVWIHDDGTLGVEAVSFLKQALPGARVVPRDIADETMAKVLSAFPSCESYRSGHPLALKVFDVAHFSVNDRYILLDSDLLFFQRPDFILDWIDHDRAGCWFNEDVTEAANVSVGEAKELLDVSLWPRVNSGLCLLEKSALDFSFCETALRLTHVTKGHVWRVEQTLFALCASRFGKGGLLPKVYEVSLEKSRRSDCVCRHYVGAVRDRFYAEGITELRRALL